ncbi:Rrf2 family transcriptional regulator [Bacillus sp. 1P06AnD]|uniref:Rrf2 family transcriptional regulator n=1 Tax=Bacillus sp. 1P06AnD TaxID=3132208 RepID=UPI00399FF5A7
MVNTRFSVAIHILALIASNPAQQMSSEFIAGSVNTNPVVIRRTSSLLKKAGLLSSRAGVTGFKLSKEPSEITLLDIYEAVSSNEEFFSIHKGPNPNCEVGKNIQSTLHETFSKIDQTVKGKLAELTLVDILSGLQLEQP